MDRGDKFQHKYKETRKGITNIDGMTIPGTRREGPAIIHHFGVVAAMTLARGKTTLKCIENHRKTACFGKNKTISRLLLIFVPCEIHHQKPQTFDILTNAVLLRYYQINPRAGREQMIGHR